MNIDIDRGSCISCGLCEASQRTAWRKQPRRKLQTAARYPSSTLPVSLTGAYPPMQRKNSCPQICGQEFL